MIVEVDSLKHLELYRCCVIFPKKRLRELFMVRCWFEYKNIMSLYNYEDLETLRICELDGDGTLIYHHG